MFIHDSRSVLLFCLAELGLMVEMQAVTRARECCLDALLLTTRAECWSHAEQPCAADRGDAFGCESANVMHAPASPPGFGIG